MDEFEKRSLSSCRQMFLTEVDIDDEFLDLLEYSEAISSSQSLDIKKIKAKREKVTRLFHHFSASGPESYQSLIHILQDDYPAVASRMEHELLIARTSFSKDINDSLLETINQQLLPLVHGTGNTDSEVDSKNQHPKTSLSTLSDLIEELQSKCLKILKIPKSKYRQTSLPALINKRIKEQQEVVAQLKAEINEFKVIPKKKNDKYAKEELTPAEKIYQLRRELQHQHMRVRLLQNSLTAKESKVLNLKLENANIQKKIHELKRQNAKRTVRVNPLFDDQE